ncbi:MAG: hypothetical protein ACK2UW_06205 [Anaerolineales bacterium]|jgi:hypothetical protein
MTIYHLIFIFVALFAVYVQTKSYALQEASQALKGTRLHIEVEYQRLRRVRRGLSPGIAALTALIVAIGSFLYGGAPPFLGFLLTGVWVLAAVGDFFVESSYAATDPARKQRDYILGMLIFILFTLGLGIGLAVYILSAVGVGITPAVIAAAAAVLLGVLAYLTLNVTPDTRLIILLYTVSVSVLLWSGLLAALTDNWHLAYIGIAYFFSDWLVGLRDFGKNPPPGLKENALILILMLYYTIMLVSIDFVF